MKVIVVFDFPEVADPNSEDADFIVQTITDKTVEWSNELGGHAYVDDAQGESK